MLEWLKLRVNDEHDRDPSPSCVLRKHTLQHFPLLGSLSVQL